MTKGIVVLAQNRANDNYVKQACLLAMSLHLTNTNANITLITNNTVLKEYVDLFDKIIPIPYGDDAETSDWKIENRWKIYHASPYDETLVLDTDMLILQDLKIWWDFLSNYDLFFTNKVFTYRDDLVTSDYYRKAFTANNLSNLYSGLHYFKKCDLAHEFYTWMEIITQNWELFYGQYVKEFYPSRPSMDVTAAIAAKILDCENIITNNKNKFPSFVHMKPKIQGWINPREKWTDCVGVYVDDLCQVKIGNYAQTGILHYVEKDFINNGIIEKYRKATDV